MEKSLLVYRFSSFGDVLLTIPVLTSLSSHYPDIRIIFVTRKEFAGYFPASSRIRVIGLDMADYGGIAGCLRLYRALRSLDSFSLVADLHAVLRTRLLNLFFSLSGLPVRSIQKPRRQRRMVVRYAGALPVQPVIQMYMAPFIRAGYTFSLSAPPYWSHDFADADKQRDRKRIGLAPFARHATKTWPFENFTELISLLQKRFKPDIYLFSSRSELQELSVLKGDRIHLVSELADQEQEIRLVMQLDLMITLDSANMHLADLCGIPVLSVWGGTDPRSGFKPFFQPDRNLIQPTRPFTCRPCSTYGKASCSLKSDPFGCLHSIAPEQVFEQACRILG